MEKVQRLKIRLVDFGIEHKNLKISKEFKSFIQNQLEDIVRTKQRCLEIDRNDQSPDNNQE